MCKKYLPKYQIHLNNIEYVQVGNICLVCHRYNINVVMCLF